MADRRITELTELTSVADGDKLVVVDVSDTTGGASGTSKYAEAKNVRGVEQTASEIAAGITPTDYSYPEGNVKRYGAVGDLNYSTDSGTDNTVAFQAAADVAAKHSGTVFIPIGSYMITSPITVTTGKVSFVGEGKEVNNSVTSRDGGSTIYLKSSTVGDYCIVLADESYATAGGIKITDLEFFGSKVTNAFNQGAIQIAGHYSHSQFERLRILWFTGYAIAHNGQTESYTQNKSLRDITFGACGGLYGVYPLPSAGDGYLTETMLTIDNVANVGSMNPADPKPYWWDFRGSRCVTAGIFLNEGNGAAGQTAVVARNTNGTFLCDVFWEEINGNKPTYCIEFTKDSDATWYSDTNNQTHIRWMTSTLPMYFDTSQTAAEMSVVVDDWSSYSSTGIAQILSSYDASGGTLTVKNYRTKTAHTLPETWWGRTKVGWVGEDRNNKSPLSHSCELLCDWDASKGSLTDLTGGNFYIQTSNVASNVIEDDGNFKVEKFTGDPTAAPKITWNFDQTPTAWEGAYVTLAIRYRTTYDAADADTVHVQAQWSSSWMDDYFGWGRSEKNNSDYTTCVVVGRLTSGLTKYFQQRHESPAPTVAPIVRIQSVKAWLGIPADIISSGGAGTGPSFAKSDGTTGGAASAGSGNQYVELVIDGTTYKVLHDGTV